MITRDQYYLFTLPGDSCLVWAEYFGADGSHVVAPTAHETIADAIAELRAAHSDSRVSELIYDDDIEECRQMARTRREQMQ